MAGPTNLYQYAGSDPVNALDSSGLVVDTAVDVGFVAYDLYSLFAGGRKQFWSNMGALGLDLAGLMIPMVTGLGALGRGANRADDLVDTARWADNGHRACSFSADTEVLMANGDTKPISEVDVGDWVWAHDPQTGDTGPREVLATIPHTDELVTLSKSSGEIVTTEDHRYWNHTDASWQEAQDLDKGDLLLTADGDRITVEALDWTTVHTAPAYDLDVADLDSFFVAAGDEAVLVHNCSPTIDVGGRRFIYGDRVLKRAVAEPGPYHNFPQTFDETIPRTGTRTVVNEGYVTNKLPGEVNGVRGVYEIGTRPSGLAQGEVITHRFFQPGG